MYRERVCLGLKAFCMVLREEQVCVWYHTRKHTRPQAYTHTHICQLLALQVRIVWILKFVVLLIQFGFVIFTAYHWLLKYATLKTIVSC